MQDVAFNMVEVYVQQDDPQATLVLASVPNGVYCTNCLCLSACAFPYKNPDEALQKVMETEPLAPETGSAVDQEDWYGAGTALLQEVQGTKDLVDTGSPADFSPMPETVVQDEAVAVTTEYSIHGVNREDFKATHNGREPEEYNLTPHLERNPRTKTMEDVFYSGGVYKKSWTNTDKVEKKQNCMPQQYYSQQAVDTYKFMRNTHIFDKHKVPDYRSEAEMIASTNRLAPAQPPLGPCPPHHQGPGGPRPYPAVPPFSSGGFVAFVATVLFCAASLIRS